MTLIKCLANNSNLRNFVKFATLLVVCVQWANASERVDFNVKPLPIDQNLRNLKLIENHVIPDVSSILQKGSEEKFADVKEFIKTGWSALESSGYRTRREIPFTLIIPEIDASNIEPSRLKEFMLEHIIPGKAFHTITDDEPYGNSNGHKIVIRKLDATTDNQWTLNGFKIIDSFKANQNLAIVKIDGVLDRKAPYAKRNIQEHNRYNEPQRLEMRNATTKNEPVPKESKSSPLMTFLGGMKTGTKVFQHFLTRSNLTQIMDDGPFTILIPADNAFQRWHPIDWGFYPFSVQEFTESVLRNHFLQSPHPIRMADVKNADKIAMKTLGGEVVVFRKSPSPSVNNVSILADYALSNGNQVFIISEVLFVSEAVVSKLHQMHKDKETPPLLAFPWFGAQFLSHSFLALERDVRFTQITRYLNNAEIAPYISGANYTFFVPEDEAFERLGFDNMRDDVLASPKGVKMLLHHFVKGRLYDRDLKDSEVFETIGGGSIKITRKPGGNVTVNNARITESEVFVYNLGTMFYIDNILYSDILQSYAAKSPRFPSTSFEASGNGVGKTAAVTTPTDVEIVPNEFFTEQSGTGDFPMHDEEIEDEVITPKALPVRFNEPPK